MKPISPISLEEFSACMERLALSRVKAVAVAVSGGPDSMALVLLLSRWAVGRGIAVHALTVDHGLRKGSAAEAKKVTRALSGSKIIHTILRWAGRKPKTRIMEAARKARYDLMAGYCRAHKIRHLFLAHHMDDQAETFLIRLAAGSGLDGLAGMKGVQDLGGSLLAMRPLLGFSKDRLVATCRHYKILFVKDPTNDSERFARPRLRKARKVLEEEGLTAKRLTVTASRLSRAQRSLDELSEKEFKTCILIMNSKRIVLNYKRLEKLVEEVRFRVLLKAIKSLRPGDGYMPRMEKIEALFSDMFSPALFRKRTLGGLVFEREGTRIVIYAESRRGGVS